MAVVTNQEVRLTQVEREVSEIKGEYRHLATKADIAEVKGELRLLKWMFGIQIAASIAFGTAILNFMYG
jgi:hypothetical protein